MNHISVIGLAMICAVPALAEGNRYGYERHYKSDLSPAAAYSELQANKSTVLIDVRSIEEFIAGHPPMSSNIPYPRVTGKGKNDPAYIGMSDAEFLAEVSSRVPDKSAPIITMCQGGGRSALAANILAKAGYSNVRSVWSGYLGKTLTDTEGKALDVNGNGIINGVTLGPDGTPASDPGDMDGWAGFNQLPTSTEVKAEAVVERLRDLYPAARK